MYVIDLLRELNPDQTERADLVSFEYRLLCSGELYNAQVITSDWRKSDVTRLLVSDPFLLTVCSHPFNDYPQELSLRFKAALLTETKGITTSMSYHDDEIAKDIAAILTLVLRRLITVAAKVREIHPRLYDREPEFLLDSSIDVVNRIKHIHWESKPATVIYGVNGIKEIIDYNPPPLGLTPRDLSKMFIALASSQHAESIVLGARQYSQALRQIEYDAGLAYQSLISCVETISNDVLQQHLPDKAAMIKAKESVYKMASRLGLKQEQCEDLAIEACSGMSWTARKFKKFLIDNIKNDFWEKDDLFQLNELFCPKQSDLESVISTIYAARGGATHGGQPYPSSITIGIGPTFPTSALLNLNLGQPCSPAIHIPPVVWFERLVNYAINSFIKSITMSDRSLNGEIERTSKDSK